jgi:hypothetical protein
MGSKEIVWRLLDHIGLPAAGTWVEAHNVLAHAFVDHDHPGQIAAPVAVVGGRKHCHQVLFVFLLVALLDHLVCAGDGLDVVLAVEFEGLVLPEVEARPSRAVVEACTDQVGVRPEQVADGPFVGHLLDSVQLPDLVQSRDIRGQAPVQPEDLAFDQPRQRKVVKQIRKVLPDIVVLILPHALIVKPIVLGDLPGLVVAPQDCQPTREAYLEGHQQGHRLH